MFVSMHFNGHDFVDASFSKLVPDDRITIFCLFAPKNVALALDRVSLQLGVTGACGEEICETADDRCYRKLISNYLGI